MKQFCPRCGTLFAPELKMKFATTQVLCAACGLSPEDRPEHLAPSEADDDQIAYDLAEWPPEDRAIATADLVELGIPYRWEDSVVLVVPAGVEEQVDALLDEIDENALADAGGMVGAPAFPDEDGEDGGEEAATAMSDLFIAADTLQHAAFDEHRIAEFLEAAAAVAGCLPPYGIEPGLWSRVQDDAASIVTTLEKGDDDEAVTAAARGLRNLLRHYI